MNPVSLTNYAYILENKDGRPSLSGAFELKKRLKQYLEGGLTG